MFSNPAYLFALAGLVIPVVIHFLSRKEGKVIKLGSVRHVVETSTQQFKGIKLNEIILLMLRCAMIAIFSLMLSGLRCSTHSTEKWAIVEQGLEGLPHLQSILDSLKNDGYSMHSLAKGFPDLKDHSKDSAQINYRQLIEDLEMNNLSEAIVFSKDNIAGFKGMRAALPPNVRWISQPLPPANFAIQAIRLSGDSVSLRTGHAASDKTYFTTDKISIDASPMTITPKDTIKIVLVSDASFNYDRKIIKAALLAIEKLIPVKIVVFETDPLKASSNGDWCLWLSTQKAENIGAKKIIRIDDQSSTELIVQEKSNQWVITKRLNQEVALQYNLTPQLAILLLPETNHQEKIRVNDRRMVSDSLAWSTDEDDKEIQASIHPALADRYLIILLIVLLMIERVIAYKRNQ